MGTSCSSCECASWPQRVLRGCLIAINVAVPATAGMWVASHGQILAAAIGVGLAAALPFVWAFAGMRPAFLLTAKLTSPHGRANLRLVMGAGFVAALWQFALLASWTLGCFWLMSRGPRAGDEPLMMIWAYGTVMAPLTVLAPRTQDLGNTRTLALFFALGACVLCAFGFLAQRVEEALWALASVTLAAAIARATLNTISVQRERRAVAGSADDFAAPAGPASPPGTARKATKRASTTSSSQDSHSHS